MKRLVLAAALVRADEACVGAREAFISGNFESVEAAQYDCDEVRLNKLKRRAEEGDASAQFKLGIVYSYKDHAESAKWYRRAAERGHVDAQIRLGSMYQFGNRIPQSFTEALKWYRKAAEQSDAIAQFLLGDMYADGRGVPQDYSEAHMWFNLAAAQGNETARKNRDLVAKKMMPADVSKAQKLAREWAEKHAE